MAVAAAAEAVVAEAATSLRSRCAHKIQNTVAMTGGNISSAYISIVDEPWIDACLKQYG